VKNILADGQVSALQDFARQRVLLAFDFDGTLAPIVRNPAAAAMRARTSSLLAKVAKAYPCVVISGRSRADAMKKVAAIPLRAVIGNHGMEPSSNLRNAHWLASLWHAQLASTLPRIAGVVIEDKGVSLAVHYRQARSRAAIRRLVLIAAADLDNTRIVEGKMVVNILPAAAPDKGTALLTLCKRLRCESAIYVGDDENDEDVFALARQGRLLGIRVGRSPRSQAAYFLPSQAAIDRLLVKLLEARGKNNITYPFHANPKANFHRWLRPRSTSRQSQRPGRPPGIVRRSRAV
jgi:trehalose 6-phosphate phosphatase